MNGIEDISTDMADAVEKIARRFALEDDDTTCADIRKLRTGIVAESSKLFPTLADEADALARVLLRSVLLRRHAIGLSGGSNISKAIH